jgi:hypothetical protein
MLVVVGFVFVPRVLMFMGRGNVRGMPVVMDTAVSGVVVVMFVLIAMGVAVVMAVRVAVLRVAMAVAVVVEVFMLVGVGVLVRMRSLAHGCSSLAEVAKTAGNPARHLISTACLLENDAVVHQVHQPEPAPHDLLVAEDAHEPEAAVRLGLDDVHGLHEQLFLAVSEQIGVLFTHGPGSP